MAKKLNILPYLRKSIFIVGIILTAALLIYLRGIQRNDMCSEVQIDIIAPSDKQLITVAVVQDLISSWYQGGLVGVSMKDIDIQELETKLNALDVTLNAEVSLQLNGILEVELTQKVPLFRVYENSQKSYYVFPQLEKLSSAGLRPARVPVVTGKLDDELITKVYTLSTYVQENPFAEALVEQIFVSDEGDLVVIPKIMSQQIIIGEPIELESKFKRLEQFYHYGLKHVGWDVYTTINLKYSNQIVCN